MSVHYRQIVKLSHVSDRSSDIVAVTSGKQKFGNTNFSAVDAFDGYFKCVAMIFIFQPNSDTKTYVSKKLNKIIARLFSRQIDPSWEGGWNNSGYIGINYCIAFYWIIRSLYKKISWKYKVRLNYEVRFGYMNRKCDFSLF